MATTDSRATTENLDDFTARVRAWADDHLTRSGDVGSTDGADHVGEWMREQGTDPTDFIARGSRHPPHHRRRRLRRTGVPAGVRRPRPTAELRARLQHAVAGFDFSPLSQFTLTLGMNAPALMEFGTEEQKRQYLPRMFDGTDLWIQFLSEPTGGSDLASAITRADQDGDEWVVNGSKIWTSTADKADMGMCLVRTNWDVPKHRGMSVLIVPMDVPGSRDQSAAPGERADRLLPRVLHRRSASR